MDYNSTDINSLILFKNLSSVKKKKKKKKKMMMKMILLQNKREVQISHLSGKTRMVKERFL
jgi:hypothetical protein